MSDKNTDFLDEMQTSEAEEVAATPETPDTDTTAAEPSDAKTGDPATPDKSAEATPAAASDKEGQVPLAALMAERDKRQQEKAQREALQRELDQIKARDQQPAPNFFEDPEAFVQRVSQSAEQQAQARLFAALEADAREQFPDFQEVMDELVEQARDNPALRDQVFNSPNPAKAAYRLGKQLREMKAMQDPDAYRAKLEAELRAKWEAEQKAKDEARAKAAADVPPDLAAARSSTGAAMPAPGSVFNEIFPK